MAQPTPVKRFVRLLQLERKDIGQILYYAIFSGIVALSLPLGIQAIINLIQGAQISTSWIVLVILVIVGVIFNGALQIMQLRIIETIQQRIFTRSSFELTYRFPKIKMEALRNEYPPELANRFFDTLIVQKGLSKILIEIPSALLQIFFALILLSLYHPFFIVFGFVLVLLGFVLLKWTAAKGLETSLQESKIKYKVAHWIQEIARSILSFKLSGSTNLALDKNNQLLGKYLEAREAHFSIIRLQFVKMVAFKVVVTAGLLLIGGALVLNQQMNIGQFVAAEIIILLVINSVEKLILGLENMYDTLTSIEKIGQVVDKELEEQEGEEILDTQNLSIVLDEVAYQVSDYKDPLLKPQSIEISSRNRWFIDGPNGSGKSILLKIITGVLSPSSGNISLNGMALAGLQINNYRKLIGSSLGEEMPFSGTIRENLVFDNVQITDEQIMEVLRLVGLAEFMGKQKQGLSTAMYPEGRQVPTSVAKKVVLARAILKKPKLLVLENPLQYVESAEAHKIMEYLTHKDRPWGLVVVSDNPEWKKNCNQLLELKKNL